ncbi:lysophospholipid acyltransferase family protein [uncultured Dubosiella sp.]|uniref:lysophospholipid acyltransferase family protein n=1 Tax=uncultured Dubosiella sp. TaxID=1937011 RepID=UPI0026195F99|nr:lysophospholipid acyltransferase family protein [uncultured Dubosiella sp.]
MIIGGNRPAVIEHIRQLAQENDLNGKAELDDPQVSEEQKKELVRSFLARYGTKPQERDARLARYIIRYYTKLVNAKTQIEGLEKIEKIDGGAVIASNHFNQLDNTVVKKMIQEKDDRRVYTVIQETNLAMPGFFGFLMNNGDNIPISSDYDYMRHEFVDLLEQIIRQKDYILIYPEQEMWFNYRKPRPGKRGAYYYASKLNVPVISCFTEIRDLPGMDDENFTNVQYIVHVLDPIYPDPGSSDHKNSIEMEQKDYEQRRAAYEKIYGKPLTYDFSYEDIAGFVPDK